MSNPQPLVSELHISIIVPLRIVDSEGNAPGSMRNVAGSLRLHGWEPLQEGATDAEQRIAHQAFSYFHPFVRRFLYDDRRVIRLRRDDLLAVNVKPGGWGEYADCRLDVEGCELWLFERTRIGVLKLDLQRPTGTPSWPLKVMQRLLDQIRRLYPPYFDDGGTGDSKMVQGGHCPREVELFLKSAPGSAVTRSDYGKVERFVRERKQWADVAVAHEERASFAWAEHWQEILAPLVTTPVRSAEPGGNGSVARTWHAVQLGDDRAALMTFVGFDSCASLRAVSPGDWVRLCYADAPGTDRYPYQQAFLAGSASQPSFEARHCYDRYFYSDGESSDAPSRILNCGYAFTWAGCVEPNKKDKGFFLNGANGAIVTFQHIYTAMGVIAQFQRAALLDSSFRISCLVKPDDAAPIDPEETGRAYDAFIWFTQWYWFDEITPQEQGQELFAMWRRELRLQELFDEVRQELGDIVDLQNANKQVELARRSTELTRIALPFAVVSLGIALLSLAAGWLGMNVIDDRDIKVVQIGAKVGLELLAWAIALLGLLLGLVFAVLTIWVVRSNYADIKRGFAQFKRVFPWHAGGGKR